MKEYKLKCKCGANYLFQGEKQELEQYLNSQTWMCELGRHVELGEKKHYLSLVGESDTLTPKPKIEPRKPDEYLACELPEGLEHIGFGIFKDKEGNIWDYRLGPEGERLYSKK